MHPIGDFVILGVSPAPHLAYPSVGDTKTRTSGGGHPECADLNR